MGDFSLDLRGKTAESLVASPATRRAGQNSDESFVVMQFTHIPSSAERAELKKRGIELLDYAGEYAYFAVVKHALYQRVAQTRSTQDFIVGSADMLGKYKVIQGMLEGLVPDYARAGERAKIYIYVRKDFTTDVLKEALKPFGNKVTITADMPTFNMVRAEVYPKDFVAIADLPCVQLMTYIESPQYPMNTTAVVLQRANILNMPATLGGLGLDGSGVKVGVWDSNVEDHIDYGHRVHQRETKFWFGDHGMHVTGSILGSGLLDPRARGNAPKAEAYTYNFKVEANDLPGFAEMEYSYNNDKITITQNSYGNSGNLNPYNFFNTDIGLDDLAFRKQDLTHIFCVGNDQGKDGKIFGSSATRTKNAILVGAADRSETISTFSSFGPMDDGRILPTVTSDGVNVYSTTDGNSYGIKSGTSMSTPQVSGAVALLTQRYKQLNNGENPRSDFMRGLVTVTARDKGNVGPDYRYGYGMMDAAAAVEVINHKQYKFLTVGQGETKSFTIHNIPAGTKSVRVMLSWTDPVIRKVYKYGESPLVNNFNLIVNQTLPWVLDPKKPSAPATRGVDNINNLEMVTIDHPTGSLTVNVSGATIPSLSAKCVVIWAYENPTPRLTYPYGGEVVNSSDTLYVRWDGEFKGPVNVELSKNSGKSYQSLSTIEDGKSGFAEIPMKGDIVTGHARIRLISGANVAESKADFKIAPVAERLEIASSSCSTSPATLTWAPVKGADSYNLYKIDADQEQYVELVKSIKDTAVVIKPEWLNNSELNAFTVTVVKEGVEGRTAKGALYTAASPVTINPINFPFHENFRQTPSPYFTQEVPETYRVAYTFDCEKLQFRPGDRVLGVSPTNEQKDWSYEKAFEPNNFVSLVNCNMQLSAELKSKNPIMTIWLFQSAAKNIKDVLFRVRVDGNVIKDLSGRDIIHPKDMNGPVYPMEMNRDSVKIGYDLSKYFDGKVHSIALDISGAQNTITALLGVTIDQADVTSLPIITKVSVGQKDPQKYTNQETLTISFKNSSVRTLKNFSLAYYIVKSEPKTDGTSTEVSFPLVSETYSEDIKPYENFNFTLQNKIDLTTTNPLGAIFTVKAKIFFDGGDEDGYPIDDIKFYNYGSVYRMNMADYDDPRDIKVVDGQLYFADNGGVVLNQKINLAKSTALFKPKHQGKAVKITFLKGPYTNLGATQLGILGPSAPTISEYPKAELHSFDRILNNDTNFPYSIVGANEEGTVIVCSTNQGDAEGWLALVEEVDKKNVISLQAAPSIVKTGNEIETHATIKNLTNAPLKGVHVKYELIGNADVKDDVVVDIPANGSAPVKFKKAVNVKTDSNVVVKVYCNQFDDTDTNAKDNEAFITLTSSEYCVPNLMNNTGIAKAKSLSCGSHSVTFGREEKGQVYYALSNPTVKPLLVEAKIDKSLKLETTSDAVTAKLWVDWNKDKTYGNDEVYVFKKTEAADSTFTVDLVEPQGVADTIYRARLIAGDKEIVGPCAELKNGSVTDFLIDYNALVSTKPDLAIESLVSPVSGESLSDSCKIILQVTNDSQGVANGFDISVYKVKPGSNDTFTQDNFIATEHVEKTINPKETVEVELKTTVDLSAIGSHTIALKLSDDADNDNNTIIRTLENVKKFPIKGGRYIDSNESWVVISPDEDLTYKSHSFEIWIKPNLQEVFFGSEFFTATNDAMGYRSDGSIYFYTLKNGVSNTSVETAPAVLKDNVWQHLAFTFKEGSAPKLYINGQEVAFIDIDVDADWDVENNTPVQTYIDFNSTSAFDQARLWNRVITPEMIKANMNKAASTGDVAKDKAMGLVWEYTFDEGAPNTATAYLDRVASLYLTGSREQSPWRAYTEFLRSSNFATQLSEPTKINDNEYSVTLRQGADRKSVEAEFTAFWDDCTFIANGVELKDGKGKLDISKDLNLELSRNIFGVELSQKVLFKFGYTKSNKTKIVKITAESPGKTPLEYDNPDQTIRVAIDPLTTATTNLTLELSKGATAKVNDQAYLPGMSVSTAKEIVIEVTAENGHDKEVYVLSFGLSDVVVKWDNDQANSVEFMSAIPLKAMSTNGAKVNFVSTNNEIATVTVDGMLKGLNVGKVDVIASVEGDTSVVKHFEVLPMKVSVRMELLSPNRMVIYPNMINNADGKKVAFNPDLHLVPNLKPSLDSLASDKILSYIREKHIYSIYRKDSYLPWTPADGFLSIGTHIIKPSEDSHLLGNYAFSFETSELEVSAGNNKVLPRKLFVKDAASDKGISGAVVTNIETNVSFKTDGQGFVTLDIPVPDNADATYTFRATHDNYNTSEEQAYQASNAAWEETPLILHAADLKFEFKANDSKHGIILGPTTQHIAEGYKTIKVIASPRTGSKFIVWTGPNGFTSFDSNIILKGSSQAAGVYTAHFAKNEDLVWKYKANEHGMVQVDGGDLVTSLELKLPAKVITFPKEGYYFVEWSDGVKTRERFDPMPVDVTAIFKKGLLTLTYTENVSRILLKAYVSGKYVPSGTKLTAGTKILMKAEITGTAKIAYWKLNDKQVTNDDNGNEYSFVLYESSNVSVKASINIPYYHFAVSVDAPSSINAMVAGKPISTNTDLPKGTEVKIEVVPAPNSVVDAWYLNGELLDLPQGMQTHTIRMSNNMDVKVKMINDAAEVKFTKVHKGGNITVQTENGIALKELAYVPMGTTLILTAVPEEGYEFVSWVLNGDMDKTTQAINATKTVVVNQGVFTIDALFKKAVGSDVVVNNSPTISPNPFRTSFEFRNVLAYSTYKVASMDGSIALQGKFDGQDKLVVDGSCLMPGIYIVTFEKSDGTQVVYKLIKM